jgi:uncharacterized membrane protein (Fun14 family)
VGILLVLAGAALLVVQRMAHVGVIKVRDV